MKKVLIALDYNPTAQKVAETGFSLAKSLNAEVTLLHVIADPVFYSTAAYSPIMGFEGYMAMRPAILENVEGLKEASHRYLEKTKHHLGDENIQILVKEGDFASTILETAKELEADFIILGSHSQKWLENILIGSVAEKVLRQTSIPLFIVPIRKDA